LASSAECRVGRFTLRPHRQLLDGSVPVSIGRKALDLLSVLAEANGALVTKDELMAAVWPNAIVEENAIQVHVAALRKVLGGDAELLHTEHGLGYRLAVTDAATAAPKTQVGEIETATPPRRRSRLRALAVLALAIVIVGAAGYAWLRYAGPAAHARTPPTIAVLAFQPADSSESAQLLANGLARSVASSLSRYDVTVIAASSSLQLAPAQKPQAHALLGADFIVDGRVMTDNGKPTVSTQVSDTQTNTLVYSFDVQGDSSLSTLVADRIATRLALSLDPSKYLGDASRKFTGTDYVLVARVNDAFENNDFTAAMDASRELAARYPGDGELQASAAIPIIWAMPSLPESERPQFLQTAKADVERAIQLAPRSGVTYYARAELVGGPMSLLEGENLERQSVQASPTLARAYNLLGNSMLQVGRVDEGVALVSRALQLDPLSDLANTIGGSELIAVGRETEATRVMSREDAIWPASPRDLALKYWMAIYFGSPQELAAVAKAHPLRLDFSGIKQADADLMLRAATTHDPALIRQMVANCFATYGQSASQVWDDICLFRMVQLGALDDAFRFAERAYPDTRRLYPPDDSRWITAPPLGLQTMRLFTPTMAAFRNDPRFWSVALRTGLVSYWQTTQAWPDFCREQLDTCKSRAAQAARVGPLPVTPNSTGAAVQRA